MGLTHFDKTITFALEVLKLLNIYFQYFFCTSNNRLTLFFKYLSAIDFLILLLMQE